MTFDAWTRTIVDGVRAKIPEARATRKGTDVILRYRDRGVRLVDKDDVWWTFLEDEGKEQRAWTYTERHDALSAGVAIANIAGHFDVRFAVRRSS